MVSSTLMEEIKPLIRRFGTDAIAEAMGEYLAANVKSMPKSDHFYERSAKEGQRKRSEVLFALAKVLRAL